MFIMNTLFNKEFLLLLTVPFRDSFYIFCHFRMDMDRYVRFSDLPWLALSERVRLGWPMPHVGCRLRASLLCWRCSANSRSDGLASPFLPRANVSLALSVLLLLDQPWWSSYRPELFRASADAEAERKSGLASELTVSSHSGR